MIEAGRHDDETLRTRIDALGPWFHNIDLGGVWTAPDHFLGDFPGDKYRRIAAALPPVAGLTVLDIGCNAGFWSLAFAQAGAARVVGIDSDPRYLAQARLAAEVRGETRVEFRELTVYDVAALGEAFDLVVFMGVFYHLRHPLLALDLIREHVARDLLLFQTLQRGRDIDLPLASDYPFEEEAIFEKPGFPVLHFVEQSYSGDPTNWFIPNPAAAQAMLRAAGFRIETRPEDDVYLCRQAERV